MDPPFFVWLVDPVYMFEKDWLYDLLRYGGIREVRECYNPDLSILFRKAVIVFNHSIDYESYFAHYEKEKIPFIAVHLSDETLSDSTFFYKHSMCKHVIRTYFHHGLRMFDNVTIIGIGYKQGFSKVPILSHEIPKYYHWCFAGNIHHKERLFQIIPFLSLKPYEFHITMDGFESKNGLDQSSYKNMLLNSKFAVCPIGQGNIETFRVYEALEANAIPIVLSTTVHQNHTPSYWHMVFPWAEHIPFIMWSDRDNRDPVQKIECILNDSNTYIEHAKTVRHFWEDAKSRWGNAIVSSIVAYLSP